MGNLKVDGSCHKTSEESSIPFFSPPPDRNFHRSEVVHSGPCEGSLMMFQTAVRKITHPWGYWYGSLKLAGLTVVGCSAYGLTSVDDPVTLPELVQYSLHPLMGCIFMVLLHEKQRVWVLGVKNYGCLDLGVHSLGSADPSLDSKHSRFVQNW